MKWLVLLLVFVALIYSAMAEEKEVDYTSRYAELASPVPSDINVPDLVASLRSAAEK